MGQTLQRRVLPGTKGNGRGNERSGNARAIEGNTGARNRVGGGATSLAARAALRARLRPLLPSPTPREAQRGVPRAPQGGAAQARGCHSDGAHEAPSVAASQRVRGRCGTPGTCGPAQSSGGEEERRGGEEKGGPPPPFFGSLLCVCATGPTGVTSPLTSVRSASATWSPRVALLPPGGATSVRHFLVVVVRRRRNDHAFADRARLDCDGPPRLRTAHVMRRARSVLAAGANP